MSSWCAGGDLVVLISADHASAALNIAALSLTGQPANHAASTPPFPRAKHPHQWIDLSSATIESRRFRALARVEFTGHPPHMTPQLKIVVEKHSDGYVAYPLGLARGTVVGQGDTYEAALSDVRSAIAFHVETFGAAALASAEDDPVLEAFVAETAVPA